MQWQRIDTAPEDKSVLIWSAEFGDPMTDTDAFEFPHGHAPKPTFKTAARHWIYEARWGSNHGYWYSWNGYVFLKKPTHWMQIPEPPQ